MTFSSNSINFYNKLWQSWCTVLSFYTIMHEISPVKNNKQYIPERPGDEINHIEARPESFTNLISNFFWIFYIYVIVGLFY